MNLLIVYASPHGSTAEIAAFIGKTLSHYDISVTVRHAASVESVDAYDAFVLGSAIHTSMWLPSLSRFMFRFANDLAAKPIYLFLTCIIALEEGGVERARTEFVWQDALDQLMIPHDNVQAFAGKINWAMMNGDEHWIIKGTYKGETLDAIKSGDYRDWDAIAAWTHNIASALNLDKHDDPDVARLDIEERTHDETITREGVANLSWPDNPGEVAAI